MASPDADAQEPCADARPSLELESCSLQRGCKGSYLLCDEETVRALGATKAMLVEVLFAIFAGGLIGAVSQQLRKAKPLWATAILVWAGLPGIMILAQFGVHRIAGTPNLGAGLVTSFCLAAVTSAF